ncbi:MAG: haloacid dehalogenase-like hydrolase [Gemmatimonadota bacterium]|nr:MAG: haloacid dehalogenase-like hydrolase [Gemmatimonadota bacterium]
MKKLILFDVDGTLLWTDGAGRAAIRQALIHEMGTAGPIDDFAFAGKTDPQIVRELLRAAAHPNADSNSHAERVCQRYAEVLESELRAPQRSVRVFQGVRTLLARLKTRDDCVVGLLTGNIEVGARLKLSAVGIDPDQFQIGAYGSDAMDRAELPLIAAERAAPLLGHVPRGEEVVILGDTPSDVTCGHGIGARAIAVATGPFSIEELEAFEPYAVFPDFTDTAAVVAAIFK